MAEDDIKAPSLMSGKDTPPSRNILEGLVQQYADFLYAAALRQVGNEHLAADVTQAVFLILQKKLPSLGQETIMSAWLLRTTRFTSLAALARERRRKHHEEQAAALRPELQSPALPNDASQIIDAALFKLRQTDRAALAGVYFEGLSHKQLAQRLEISEASAHKRVQRAVARLGKLLSGRGAILSAPMISGLLATVAQPAAAPAAVKTGATQTIKGSPAAEIVMLARQSLLMAKFFQADSAARAAVVCTLLLLSGAAAYWLFHKPQNPAAPPVVQQTAKPAAPLTTAPASPEDDEAEKRLGFVLAQLDKRDDSLRNFTYSLRYQSVNVVPSTGQTTLVRTTEYEFRRKDATFWQHTTTHPDSRITDEILYVVLNTWNGTASRSVGFPPYNGSDRHLVRISVDEPSNFRNLDTNSLLGLRGMGPTAISGSMARWIESKRRIKVAIEVQPPEENADRLWRVTIHSGPSVAEIIYLDPAHDFAICRMSSQLKVKTGEVRVDVTLQVTAWQQFAGVWLPTRAIKRVVDSNKPDHRQDVTYELHDIAVGTVTDADVTIAVPKDAKVIDAIRHLNYIANPDGTYTLSPLADQKEGVVYVPINEIVDSIDGDPSTLYRTTPILPSPSNPNPPSSAPSGLP